MVDCGLPFSKIKPYLYQLQLVLLTHEHSDHINLTTLKTLQFERPSLRIGCCDWMLDKLSGLKNIDVYNIGSCYEYGHFSIYPIKLYHDVPNCGYKIIKGDYKIIHATDTAHLNGIDAKGYDLYAIEHNYNEDTTDNIISAAKLKGEYCHRQVAINSHLSEQQANDFIYKNKGDKYEVLRLHESKST